MNRTTRRPHALPSLSLVAAALIASAIVALAGVSSARAATASLPANATVNGIGSVVNIDLTLSGATGTEAADIDVTYNASVVRIAADALIGQLGTGAGCQVTTNAATVGVVRFGVACANPTASAGVLLTIPFQAFAPGVSDLTVSRCSLNEDAIACTGGVGQITVTIATPTSAQTSTRTPTATLAPPSATPTRTRTNTATVPPPTPSLTRTRTATFTVAPPTATRTSTLTATITRTSAPIATATRTSTGTATAISTPSMSALAILASCPTTMTAGQQNVVTVTMRNNGTTTWTEAQGYRLGAVNPYDNFNWGMNRVLLGAADSIAPGQDKVFTWTVTAPAAAGTYNFQWRMVRESVAWFGDLSSNVTVVVNAPPPTATRTSIPPSATPTRIATSVPTSTRTPIATSTRTPIATATRTATASATRTDPPVVIDGVFVSQSVPTTMTAGQQVSVSVTMRNSGTTTWSAGNLYRLGAINPYDNFTWGMNRVPFAANENIGPGQQKTFTWNVTAPPAGTYNFQWRMVQEGVMWFGQTTPNVVVTVNAAPPAPSDAAFVAQMFPTTVAIGQQFTASVTMKNTGGTTWTAAQQFRLGSYNPPDTIAWGSNRVNLAPGDSIAPGQEKTFTWTATAPPAAGFYNFQWRMVQDGVAWFGQSTTNLVITVPQQ